jgi:hypothetical protein
LHRFRKLSLVLALCSLVFVGLNAMAQRADVAFAVSGVTSPSPNSSLINSGLFFTPTEGGGTYLGFNGDVIIKHDFGVEGEVNWRATQNLYLGYQPYRPIFYDFNAVWAPKLNKHLSGEILGGIGAESLRFYTNYYNCSYFGGCTNYTSSNHFMGDIGGGVKLSPWGHLFVRPEVRVYFVHNNVEFASDRVIRAGVSIGYTFGGD